MFITYTEVSHDLFQGCALLCTIPPLFTGRAPNVLWKLPLRIQVSIVSLHIHTENISVSPKSCCAKNHAVPVGCNIDAMAVPEGAVTYHNRPLEGGNFEATHSSTLQVILAALPNYVCCCHACEPTLVVDATFRSRPKQQDRRPMQHMLLCQCGTRHHLRECRWVPHEPGVSQHPSHRFCHWVSFQSKELTILFYCRLCWRLNWYCWYWSLWFVAPRWRNGVSSRLPQLNGVHMTFVRSCYVWFHGDVNACLHALPVRAWLCLLGRPCVPIYEWCRGYFKYVLTTRGRVCGRACMHLLCQYANMYIYIYIHT